MLRNMFMGGLCVRVHVRVRVRVHVRVHVLVRVRLCMIILKPCASRKVISACVVQLLLKRLTIIDLPECVSTW